MNHFLICFLCFCIKSAAFLRPQDSETRETKSLDGVWNFKLSPKLDPDAGFRELWFAKALESSEYEKVIPMPVPSSYNDITQDVNIRDFVGWAWYDRTFFVPSNWKTDKIVTVRFGSAHYEAKVWVNGHLATEHSGGHLPFEADVTDLLNFWDENRITVAINNTLTPHTVPQGRVVWKEESAHYPKGYFELDYEFDFFNYAGIHRPVVLYTKPKRIHVNDVTVVTTVSEDLQKAFLTFEINKKEEGGEDINNQTSFCMVTLLDQKGQKVAEVLGLSGSITIDNPNLWWPYLMHDNPGYLYQMKVWLNSLTHGDDFYRINVGLRSVDWNSTGFFINHKLFYFQGFGRHEDSDIRGKGLDLPLVAKDFNLMKWVGANSFRTSHYPYAEEILDFADSQGIVVIDECPAVAIDTFDAPLLENHKKSITELIRRDKNRPSVVMWSLANEPRSSKSEAKDYFKSVIDHTKSLDQSRPTMVVVNSDPVQDQSVQSVDIVGINRYFAWYSDTGHTELIARQMAYDIEEWHNVLKKPIMVAEYGADTIAGFHQSPAFIFTEEYQTELMLKNFEAFDELRKKGLLIGEMIWNFADFMTKQAYHRALGNRKGIFTRQRQPKMSAHLLRRRYLGLAKEGYSPNVTVPDSLACWP